MKFIHITDPHLVEPGARLYELDPLERLELCIADINRNHADAEFAIVTGDLAHVGQVAAYRALKGAFAKLRLKTYFMLGNHDDRGNFLEVFAESPRDPGGFVQFSFDTAIGRFVCLDTNEPKVSWGALCDARLAWFKAELARAGDRPIYLFMHHPPFPVGLKRMDEISLQQPEKFIATLADRRNIRHLFFGHLHRPIAGSWRGIPISTMRATSHQVALDFVIERVVPGSHEPPAYAVVLADSDQTVVHFHDFLDKTNTFML
jgi:3',5'-cyclic AMP phosphodiesterase CpdA